MLQRLRRRAQGQEGFTLIELLVVILIIGILAAVAIPVFLNQTGKANDANVQSDINSAQTALETYYTSNQTYDAQPSDLESIDPTLSNAFTGAGTGKEDMTVTGTTNTYSIVADDPNGISFTLARDDTGDFSRTCSVPQGVNPGGCKLTGTQSTTAASPGSWGTTGTTTSPS